jgi:ComEC/Rec2-related protein
LLSGSEVTFEGKPMFMENGSAVSPFHRSLSCRGIRYVFYLKSESLSVVTSGTDMRDVARDRLSASCDALFNRQTSSVVKALYFGNQNYIDKSILNDFKRAGVLHVLSASGLHVGVVAAVPLFALGLLRLNRKYVLTVSALVVVLYLYVTDMPVSLLRASIMFLMYALYRMVDREANIINTLFLSALVILVLFPYEIYSLGFQLSFGATLGILLLFRLYRNTFAYLPGRISDSLALTVAAQVPVIPVLFARVGEVNVTCVMSNLIVVPAMSLLLVVSLVANGLFALTSHAAYIGHCADALFAASTYIIGFISGLGGHFKVAAVHPVLIAAFGMILLPLFPGLSRKKIMSLSIVSGFVIACLFFAISPARDEGARVITHGRGSTLLVKQGDSLSVIGSLPERSQIGLVMREIDKISFRTILIYIPGPDYRNISGYSYLIKRIPVRRCYLSDKFPLKKYMKKFFLLLEGDGVELVLHDFQSRCGAAGTSPQVAAAGSEPERIFARYRALVK